MLAGIFRIVAGILAILCVLFIAAAIGYGCGFMEGSEAELHEGVVTMIIGAVILGVGSGVSAWISNRFD